MPLRVLVIDPEREQSKKEGEPDGPLSFFFSESLADAESFDLIVLPVRYFLSRPDVLPPGIPVLAFGSVDFLADALAGGCVDYLREPWCLEELEARALRFWRLRFSLGSEAYRYSYGVLEGRASIRILSPGENMALELLLHRLGKPVPRGAFARTLSRRDSGLSRLADMTICRLRKSLVLASGDAGAGAFLVAVRNYGYILVGKPCV